MSAVLCDMTAGQSGRIVGFGSKRSRSRQKLLSMGLTPGTTLTVTRVAPMGDPVEIRVRGFALSLRKDEAEVVLIEPKVPVWDD